MLPSSQQGLGKVIGLQGHWMGQGAGAMEPKDPVFPSPCGYGHKTMLALPTPTCFDINFKQVLE